MQATKVKGIINQEGKLIIEDPINLVPGEVEVIVLQSINLQTEQLSVPKRQSPSQVKALKEWFENTQPTSADFDPEQAKWEYLKEKHNL
ncbi:hypothetical protein [Aphanothece sacrum]|uniref:DNA repair nucleotidyltransferase n=1 Tax=Aphanothece sacrum FPU1 TaxID=1920663 RepID=A0A401IDF1_APHSA|nr:hypothetical protein [Aphanothece sacrum]GBF79271.1 DNA repair nucleotidyltransferase [Aphanothece sacrum FPU1]GBF86774.1 DNA repair nucleotidyltransferase [Aphanothece sacrum FPU3]